MIKPLSMVKSIATHTPEAKPLTERAEIMAVARGARKTGNTNFGISILRNVMTEKGRNVRERSVWRMRLIDADDLAAKIMMDAPGFLDGGSEITKAFILAMVKTRSVTPTIDAVPVVRCKDCKHYKDGFCYNPNTYDDDKTRGNTVPDWFCADGVKDINVPNKEGR